MAEVNFGPRPEPYSLLSNEQVAEIHRREAANLDEIVNKITREILRQERADRAKMGLPPMPAEEIAELFGPEYVEKSSDHG